jgi:hypothetical protein
LQCALQPPARTHARLATLRAGCTGAAASPRGCTQAFQRTEASWTCPARRHPSQPP